MKNVIIASGLVLIIILTIFTGLTIYSNNSRQNEVEEALTVAVEQALANLKIDKQYSVTNTDEFVADFVQRLVLGIDSDSNISVNILAVDIEKGLLDVEIVETYRQPNGSDGTASYRKTVILDEVYEDTKTLYSVIFMAENSYGTGNFEVYKSFSIVEGCDVIFPGIDPSMSDRTFVGWSLTEPTAENGYSPEISSGLKVNKNLTFYAVFQ